MKKNLVVILLIFVVPVFAYYLLSNKTVAKQDVNTFSNGSPSIIKFSSPLCRDCKTLSDNMNKVYPKYKDKINLQHVSVDKKDSFTKDMVKKYHITLVPTLLFMNKDGVVVKRVEGSLTSNVLENHMKDLIDGKLR